MAGPWPVSSARARRCFCSAPGRSERRRSRRRSPNRGPAEHIASILRTTAIWRDSLTHSWRSNRSGGSLSWTKSKDARISSPRCGCSPTGRELPPDSCCSEAPPPPCSSRVPRPWRAAWRTTSSPASTCPKSDRRTPTACGSAAGFPGRSRRAAGPPASAGVTTSSIPFSRGTLRRSAFPSRGPRWSGSGRCWRTTTARSGTARSWPGRSVSPTTWSGAIWKRSNPSSWFAACNRGAPT